MNVKLTSDFDESCCVCFNNYPVILMENVEGTFASLADIQKELFEDNKIPDDILITSACNEHFLCIGCLRQIVNNYENHPINEHNSHVYCPYPFKECRTLIGFRNIFDHHLIQKICKNELEWTNFKNYTHQYRFPGFMVLNCLCGADILLEIQIIKDTPIGDLIVECTQNPMCYKRWCYYCKQPITYNSFCYTCKMKHETENPNMYNYYFNKNIENILAEPGTHDEEANKELSFEESDYLYLNKELTIDIATNQIIATVLDPNYILICPICKYSLFKTEKCNALLHHNVERCYACSRIGFKTKGLGEHWATSGVGGCFRFDHDSFVDNYADKFLCNEKTCFNHDMGDCQIVEHQPGIEQLSKIRHKSYIYHMFKSLPSTIKYIVYDKVYQRFADNKDALDFLPYKQTLCLLEQNLEHFLDFSEEIFYDSINCQIPIFDKQDTITNYTSLFVKIKQQLLNDTDT